MEWVARVGAKHQIRAQRGTFLVFQEGKGEVGRVRQEGKGGERVEHQKHASVGTFVVFDTKGRAGNVSNTKDMPTRACSWCST